MGSGETGGMNGLGGWTGRMDWADGLGGTFVDNYWGVLL